MIKKKMFGKKNEQQARLIKPDALQARFLK